MNPLDARKATPDDVLGMAWWNGLTEQRGAYWLQLSKSNVARHAWDYFKQVREVEGEITA